jgi:hypothetical protein
VLISGGDGPAGAIASVEIYDVSGAATEAPAMSVARSEHSCAALGGGLVLVAGGRGSGGGATNTAEIYDAAAGSWRTLGLMTSARAGATATVLQDGRVLIAGGEAFGHALATLEVFDPTLGVFNPVSTLLSAPRKEHASALLPDGRVLIAGGHDGAAALVSADIYDPATGSVTPAGRMLAARAGLTATSLLDGRVLLAGGANQAGEVGVAELYDANSGAFSAAGVMSTPRRGHRAYRIPDNNTVLIVGGAAASEALAAAEQFIPWEGRFRPMNPLADARSGATGSPLLPKGWLLVGGGSNTRLGLLASLEIVTVATLSTDKPDYTPGETVTLGGTGWEARETVRISLRQAPRTGEDLELSAVADENGMISLQTPARQEGGAFTYLTAKGASSDAATRFTIRDLILTEETTSKATDAAPIVGAAAITTNKTKYAVGETMVISGTGFAANATITVSILRPDRVTDVRTTTSNASGAFSLSYTPPPIPGRYKITATDGSATANTAATEADAIGYNKGVYNKDTTAHGGPGDWTTGNAGSNYLENQWVFYQYQITGVTGTVPSFDVTFNHFQSNTNAIFIDAFANFRVCLDDADVAGGCTSTFTSGPKEGMLLDDVPFPPTSTANWKNAAPAISNINRPFVAGVCSSTEDAVNTPSDFHCFHVDGPALATALGGIPAGTHTITLFYEAHLSSTFVWKNGNESLLGCDSSTAWVDPQSEVIPANTVYGTDAYASGGQGDCTTGQVGDWNGVFNGVGFATGSSRHFNITNQTEGSQGGLSLPIPTVPAPTGSITIVKVTNPATAVGAVFGFSGDLGAFNLDTDPSATNPNSKTFTDLAGGLSYTVTESSLPAGWTLTNLACVNNTGASTFVYASPTVTINLANTSGASVTCTFTNTGSGHIIVDKVTSPSGDPQSFSFTTTGAGYSGFSLTDAATPNDQTLVPGTYTVSETLPAGWDLTSRVCSLTVSGSGTSTFPASGTTQPASITLGAGDTVTCTFTDTKRAHIIVDKVTSPSGDPQSFTFVTTGAGYAGFSLTDAATPNDSGALLPGVAYTVSETVPAGWDLTSRVCVETVAGAGGSTFPASGTTQPATITPAAGATITCTFTDTKRAHIIVDKVTSPSGAAQSFDFVTTGAGYAGFSLTDAATPNDSGALLPGVAYTVAETVPAGWSLSSRVCVETVAGAGGSTFPASGTTQPATITPAAGATITCTFTDTQGAHIIVDKVTSPSGDPQSFTFVTTGAGYAGFSLTDAAAPNDSGVLTPGVAYTVSETVPAGWDLTSRVCVETVAGAGGSTFPASGTTQPASITLAAGATITCTFTDTKRAHIIVDKVTNPSADPQSFAFVTTGAGYAGFSLTDAAAPNDSGALVPGVTYTVAETVPAGWDLTSRVCVETVAGAGGSTFPASGTTQPASITPAAGATITCTFTDTKRGKIIIDKVTIPSLDPQNFAFTLTGGPSALNASFGLTDASTPFDSGLILPGSGFVAGETLPSAEWVLTSALCNDGSPVGNINVSPGETVTCTFTNTKQAKVQVLKTFQGQPITGSETFAFTLRTGATTSDSGTTLQALVGNSSNGGTLNFTPFLIPGNTYQICEVVLPGWQSSISSLSGAFVIQTEPDGDNSTICVPFTPTPGQNVVFTIDNTPPPGGDARTIGFWKNWASCSKSKGNQDPILDQTLALFPIAGGQSTHGIFIGDVYVDTCEEAVALLNKEDINSGRKRASDPGFNLAAQLLAAQLNVQAGAGTCAAATTAINDAQALLDSVNFDGVGNTSMNPAQGTQANQLAATLDSYNNNTLCPP